jgi:hypothetical protein
LAAESKITKKLPIPKMEKASSAKKEAKKKEINRTSYGSELSK